MTRTDFSGWVKLHCAHTGADADSADVLMTNHSVVIGKWKASYKELCECTTRMIENGRCPRFANEQLNALHAELISFRVEKSRVEMSGYAVVDTGDRIKGCDCPRCMPPDGSAKYQYIAGKFKEWLKRNNGLLGGIGLEVPR